MKPFPGYPTPPEFTRELGFFGVTGTNGKTSTTFYLSSALAEPSQPTACVTTLGSYLNGARLSLPNTYQGMLEAMRTCLNAGGRQMVLEVTSEVLARGFAKVWPFEVAVFTNLSEDHLDAHQSVEHYFASKAQLFHHLSPGKLAVLNGNDEVSPLLAEIIPSGVRVLSYGRASLPRHLPLDVVASEPIVSWGGTRVALDVGTKLGALSVELAVPTVGDVFADNATAAFTAAVASGLPASTVVERIAHTPHIPGRFECVSEQPRVVVDYAHTPDALSRILQAARSLCEGTLWLVFGAGGGRDRNKRPLMGKAAMLADRVVLTNDNPRHEQPETIAQEIRSGADDPAKLVTILDRRQAIEHAILGAQEQDLIVIAGKGHEVGQWFEGRQLPFSDSEVAQALMNQRKTRNIKEKS